MCYRISHQGNGTCNLSPKIPPRSGTIFEDPDYDVYVKKQECRYLEPTPPSYHSPPKPADCKYQISVHIRDSGAGKTPADPPSADGPTDVQKFFVCSFGLDSVLLALNQPLKEMSARGVFCGGKGDRYVGLTTLPSSCADCLEILRALRAV